MPREDVLEELRARRRAGKPTYWDIVQREDFHLWYSGMKGSWTRESILDALREREQGRSLKPEDTFRYVARGRCA